MMDTASFVFLYPFNSEPTYVAKLVTGEFEPPADRIDFTDPSGGSESRELAIPFLAGMDEIRVDAAEIRLRSGSLEVESNSHTTASGPGNQGVFLGLPSPGLLRTVVLEYSPPVPQVGKTFRLVVRLATRSGTGFTAGVPIFAEPALASLGPMYGPALPGFALTSVATNRVQLTLPSLMGDAWLFQIASGDTPDALAPQPIVPAIRTVVLQAAPKDVVVSLVASSGNTVLWSNPGTLAVGNANAAGKLHSTCTTSSRGKTQGGRGELPGSIDLVELRVGGRRPPRGHHQDALQQLCRPAPRRGCEKITVPGDRAALTFDLPTGFRPASNSFRLTLQAKPRKRDPLSPAAPTDHLMSGLRAGRSEHVASGMPVSGEAAVTAARLCLAAPSDVEAVMTLRADAGGIPGEPIAAPAVFRLSAASSPAWIDVDLPALLALGAGKLWIALHTNRGDLYWYTHPDAPGEPRISRDEGMSWTAVPDLLASPAKLLSQLLIAADPIACPPRLALLAGDTVLHDNLLSGIAGAILGEFVVPAASFPSQSLGVAKPSGGSTSLRFDLSSDYQCEATIEDFIVLYDPATATGAP